MKAIIAAAGTGGHINPGLAIANEIKKQEPNSQILFIGTNRGLENDLVPRAGYQLKTINAYGFDRTLSLKNIKKMWQTFHSIKQAKKIIAKFKPDVVIRNRRVYLRTSWNSSKQKKCTNYIARK